MTKDITLEFFFLSILSQEFIPSIFFCRYYFSYWALPPGSGQVGAPLPVAQISGRNMKDSGADKGWSYSFDDKSKAKILVSYMCIIAVKEPRNYRSAQTKNRWKISSGSGWSAVTYKREMWMTLGMTFALQWTNTTWWWFQQKNGKVALIAPQRFGHSFSSTSSYPLQVSCLCLALLGTKHAARTQIANMLKVNSAMVTLGMPTKQRGELCI